MSGRHTTSRKFDTAIVAIEISIANVTWLFGLFGYYGLLDPDSFPIARASNQ